jgi:hypothetical protein
LGAEAGQPSKATINLLKNFTLKFPLVRCTESTATCDPRKICRFSLFLRPTFSRNLRDGHRGHVEDKPAGRRAKQRWEKQKRRQEPFFCIFDRAGGRTVESGRGQRTSAALHSESASAVPASRHPTPIQPAPRSRTCAPTTLRPGTPVTATASSSQGPLRPQERGSIPLLHIVYRCAILMLGR